MKTRVWLSFDLGIRGDLEGIYQFLDAHAAQECGYSLASFWYEYKDDLVSELTKELKASVDVDQRTRVYIIFLGPQSKYVGKFIIGRRKAPPWAGYGPLSGDQEEDIGA